MRLIQQTQLYQAEGAVVRVFELELCELTPSKFLVNFRYGRQGGPLREGTRTTHSVDRSTAEKLYQQLLAEQLNKGYTPTPSAFGGKVTSPTSLSGESQGTAFDATAATVGETSQAEIGPPLSPRDLVLLRYLGEAIRSGDGQVATTSWPLSRIVWRVGLVRLRQAEMQLLKLLGTGSEMLDYCLVWALGRCGGPGSTASLRAVADDEGRAEHVRRMAAEAEWMLTDTSRRGELILRRFGELPDDLSAALAAQDLPRSRMELDRHLSTAPSAGFSVLEQLYAIDDDASRSLLMDVMRSVPFKPHYFQRIRRIFKSAELRGDGQMYGLLARRFATESPQRGLRYAVYYHRQHRQPNPFVGDSATSCFSVGTATHFRKHSWRFLSGLGRCDRDEYATLAAGVLAAFSDTDRRSTFVLQTWRYERGRYRHFDVHYDEFAGYWVFNKILYGASPRYTGNPRTQRFACHESYRPGNPAPAVREESFPRIWDRNIELVLQLLRQSGCEPVHKFAALVLRDARQFWSRLELEVLVELLAAPYEITAETAFLIAASRFDPAEPDFELVLAVAHCHFQPGRRQSQSWVSEIRSEFFRHPQLAARLLAGPFRDTRQFAAGLLPSVQWEEASRRALVGALFAQLMALAPADPEGDSPSTDVGDAEGIARDLAKVLLEHFTEDALSIPVEVLLDLAGHPLEGVQLLAADMLERHVSLANCPPLTIVQGLIDSAFPAVRQAGVAAAGRMPAAGWPPYIDWLVQAAAHGQQDVREGMRPLVKQLAEADSAMARSLADSLIERILLPGAAEGVPSHLSRVLREDFASHMAHVPPASVWRLLQSRSRPAQQVGGVLLGTNVRAENMEILQLVKLASHEIITVRQAAQNLFAESLPRVRRSLSSAVRILDAAWEDSRAFAFRFFEEQLDHSEFTPEILVSICDSVRDDVQNFGRRMIQQHFRDEDGLEYLLKLSEHPSRNLQLFATSYLESYAGGNVSRLRELQPFFVRVLSAVNRGRVAKKRVHLFLKQESGGGVESAEIVAEILSRVSATCAIEDRASAIELLTLIKRAHPQIETPLRILSPEVRHGV